MAGNNWVQFEQGSTDDVLRSRHRPTWKTLSFPSTLHLQPILDLLLTLTPDPHQLEVRLGLQEALVNAAKHGNALDPAKSISVRYARYSQGCYWIIEDQGAGFTPPSLDFKVSEDWFPCEDQSCGRGLFILHQVFDEISWNAKGTTLTLYKRYQRARKPVCLSCAS